VAINFSKPEEAVCLEQAYSDLTRPAFGTWLRLMAEPRGSLEKSGITALAGRIGVSRRVLWYWVRELRDKGYLRVVSPTRVGATARLLVVKRPSIATGSNFVRL
jgi:hypothetical protein